MTLQDKPIIGGATLFVPVTGPTGKVNHKAGTVIDMNEAVGEVKLRLAIGPKTITHLWYPVKTLLWEAPKEDAKC